MPGLSFIHTAMIFNSGSHPDRPPAIRQQVANPYKWMASSTLCFASNPQLLVRERVNSPLLSSSDPCGKLRCRIFPFFEVWPSTPTLCDLHPLRELADVDLKPVIDLALPVLVH
jgi:hypothetical protein